MTDESCRYACSAFPNCGCEVEALESPNAPCPSKDPAGVGYEAFLVGTPYTSSPYGDDNENNAHWRWGWRQACKDRKVPSDEMDSLWCTLNGSAASGEIERLRVDLMNVRERLRLAEEDVSRKREALEAVQSEILLTGHLAEIVDGAIP